MKRAIFAMAIFSVLSLQLGPMTEANAISGKNINVSNIAKVAVATVSESASTEQVVTEPAAEVPPAPQPITVKVKKGDTLIKIAAANQTTYQRLYDANTHIVSPHVINPGDTLRIPFPDEQLASRALPVVPTAAPVVKLAAKVTTKKSTVQAPAVAGGGVWDSLAKCESGGNWAINTGNGYYGGLQFTLATWKGVGGSGYPHQASREEQILRAEILLARSGWGQWPVCTTKLGLR